MFGARGCCALRVGAGVATVPLCTCTRHSPQTLLSTAGVTRGRGRCPCDEEGHGRPMVARESHTLLQLLRAGDAAELLTRISGASSGVPFHGDTQDNWPLLDVAGLSAQNKVPTCPPQIGSDGRCEHSSCDRWVLAQFPQICLEQRKQRRAEDNAEQRTTATEEERAEAQR